MWADGTDLQHPFGFFACVGRVVLREENTGQYSLRVCLIFGRMSFAESVRCAPHGIFHVGADLILMQRQFSEGQFALRDCDLSVARLAYRERLLVETSGASKISFDRRDLAQAEYAVTGICLVTGLAEQALSTLQGSLSIIQVAPFALNEA